MRQDCLDRNQYNHGMGVRRHWYQCWVLISDQASFAGHSWVESYPEIRTKARIPPTENTPEWCSQHYHLHQTLCRSHAVIHLLQNNSFVLSFPSLWQKGTKAPHAAGKIHTDFEKGFIMAEVMKFQDFKEEGSESAVKVSSQGARGWGEVSCDQWAWQSPHSSYYKLLFTFTQGKKLLLILQHSWQASWFWF